MYIRLRLSLSVLIILCFIQSAISIKCFQCSGTNSTHPFQCNEWLSDYDMEPQSCDSVYGAKYCIKHIGRFEVFMLKCYQCSTTTSLDCAEGLIHMGGIEPTSCDHVFEAQYCIKSTAMDGGIGAKRFCSSLDLGSYCNYVKQPGDILEYRTCVYTCTGDGCNSSNHLLSSKYHYIPSIFIIILSVVTIL